MRRIVVVCIAAALLASGAPDSAASGEAHRAEVLLPPGAGTDGPAVFLVSYDPDAVTGPGVVTAIRDAGGGAHAFTEFPVVAAGGSRDVVDAVAGLEGVTHIEPDAPIELHLNAGPHAIAADAVRAPEADGGLGVDGAGVTIGVIDSGADGAHPDLAGPLQRNVKVVTGGLVCVADGCDEDEFIPDPVIVEMENTDTTSGHGSHVAGIAAGDGTASDGRFTGVAPGARLNAVGVGDMASVIWALEGFNYLLAHAEEDNLAVINNSWGARDDGEDSQQPTHATARAVEAAIGQGVSVVFAAGNDGCPEDAEHSTINPYALIPGVISVASSLRDGEDVSDFSSCGKGAERGRDHDPTLTAPGSDITSARGGPALYSDILQEDNFRDYLTSSGTSMAAPHVAGVVALMQSAREQEGEGPLAPAAVKEILAETASPIDGVEQRRQGAGLVDAGDAVAAAAEVSEPEPITLPACPIVTDEEGDATAALWNTPMPSTDTLDVVEAELVTDTEGERLEATIHVVDLDLDALESGTGMYLDVFFRYGGELHYLFARYDKGTGDEGFGIGRLVTTRETLAEGEGSFDTDADEIRWSVPLGGEGYELADGTSLSSVQVVSRRQLANFIPDADEAWAARPFPVGETCEPSDELDEPPFGHVPEWAGGPPEGSGSDDRGPRDDPRANPDQRNGGR